MDRKHLNILAPFWQGGGQDISTYEGALELEKYYLKGLPFERIDIGTDKISNVKNNILGYREILEQVEDFAKLLSKEKPNSIFTVGGGCDADLIPISYMNQVTDGDMVLLYFDAHGDLNTPDSSGSKLFYGMPVRTLLGDGNEKIVDSIYSKLKPSQIVYLGARELDTAESEYIEKNNIPSFSVDDIETNIDNVLSGIEKTGFKNVYVHIDLDVLDPDDFSYIAVPESGGLKVRNLITALDKIIDKFNVVGLGLFEYTPSGIQNDELLRKIVEIGQGL